MVDFLYPWKEDPLALLDHKNQAERRLKATERRLANQPKHAKAYDNQMKEMTEPNLSRKLFNEESYEGPIPPLYMSHHAVIRPDKKSTTIRMHPAHFFPIKVTAFDSHRTRFSNAARFFGFQKVENFIANFVRFQLLYSSTFHIIIIFIIIIILKLFENGSPSAIKNNN